MRKQLRNPTGQANPALLWAAAGILLLALLFSQFVWQSTWVSVGIAVALAAALGFLIQRHRKDLRSRTVAFGVYSGMIALLVVALVGVLNFLAAKHPLKKDLTKNRIHTLSEQTEKVIRGLQKEVKATYWSKLNQREEARPLLDNLKGLNAEKFKLEYVDPDKEPTRAKQAAIKAYGTLQLQVGPRDTKVESPTEEKVTNELIKLLKDRSPTLCAITGHGERSFSSAEADGYDAAKKALASQAYELKEINLAQEGKIPESCDAIAILGPTKSFFEPEVKLVRDYLDNGGRALVALDVDVKTGRETAAELLPVLERWYVRPTNALVIDPLSRLFGADASIPIIASFQKEHALTRDFQAECYFPFTRPLEVLPGAPQGLTVQWVAQTTPKAMGVQDLSQISKGQVRFDPKRDKQGPLNAVVAAEGKQKDSKAQKSTRLLVFGSSQFATNNYSRFGANLDLFLNSISYLMEDESLIAIRAKEEGPGKVELSATAGRLIGLICVVVLPLLIAVAGLVIWIYRRRL
jgi:ABC-type uncharacterized transport system involved in gliding motility auxiliary subunit